MGKLLCRLGIHRATGQVVLVPITWMKECPCGAWSWAWEFVIERREAGRGVPAHWGR